MTEDVYDLVRRIHMAEIERIRNEQPTTTPEHPEVELPDAEPGSSIAEEWDMFRREVKNLIREGGKGRFALVKSGQPITIWDSLRDAAQAGQMLYGQAPCLVQEIQPYLKALSARLLVMVRGQANEG
jgi:hypothetical protein